MYPFSRSFIGAIGRYTAGWRALRDEIRTENVINGLPNHIRKDIGWPDSRAARRSARLWER